MPAPRGTCSDVPDFGRERYEVWTRALNALFQLGVPEEAWPRHATQWRSLLHSYMLHSPLQPAAPRIGVLLTVQRFEIPSQDIGTEHSVHFPFSDDAHAAWEACKRLAGWQPLLPRRQPRVAAALQGHLLPHSGNADAPTSVGAGQPAAQDERDVLSRKYTRLMKAAAANSAVMEADAADAAEPTPKVPKVLGAAGGAVASDVISSSSSQPEHVGAEGPFVPEVAH